MQTYHVSFKAEADAIDPNFPPTDQDLKDRPLRPAPAEQDVRKALTEILKELKDNGLVMMSGSARPVPHTLQVRQLDERYFLIEFDIEVDDLVTEKELIRELQDVLHELVNGGIIGSEESDVWPVFDSLQVQKFGKA